MKIEEYRKLLREDIKIACNLNSTTPKEEFLSYVTGLLINGEEFDDFTECYCEGTGRQNRTFQIDGYSMDTSDGSCCVFISEYFDSYADTVSVNKAYNDNMFKKIRNFVVESIETELYRKIINASAKDFSSDLYFTNDKILKYRFYFITDAYNNQREKNIKDSSINGRPVELNVWDIERIYDLVSSQIQKESVEISLSEFGIEGIPCVKAVDYRNVVADIDILPESSDDGSASNIVTYSSYLAVVPGEILNRLYMEYGAKLLEGNVRSFLSAKGKVNRSIRSTIKNYPEMFFAYNNGIAATATKVETRLTPEGPVITYIKDLQIVNGGQTTASIANTLLSAKKGDNIDLSKIAVPMKLSVLEHSMAERIIPKISEYSNSQNKVEASDFFSNHPFHIRMEELSRRTATPSKGGNQFQQYWFYERARGQYNQGKMKVARSVAQLKKYTDRYPANQVITMLDLAKYMLLFNCRPDIVSKGKQKMLEYFAENTKRSWEKTDAKYNESYFKRVVALAIIYKQTDDIIKQSGWYRENRSYKSNVAAYTMSVIFNYIKKKQKGYELDFKRIWNDQAVYEELEEQIDIIQEEVHNFITGPRSTENVTEWCKKELCWEMAQKQMWTINDDFVASLISKEEAEKEDKDSGDKQKIANEISALKEIFSRKQNYWKEVLAWGKQRNMLTDKEISILNLTVNMFVTGRTISDKQAQVVIATRKKLIDNGMPMQFK